MFSWQYCAHPEGGCAQLPNYDDVTDVEAVDAQTIKVTFGVPKPYPYGPFVGALVQRAGRIRGLVNDEHYHDMGKLVFAFVVFWAYIGFSQFMLMWYANLPEETVWYAYRMNDTWANVSWLMLFGHFVAPFSLKRTPDEAAAELRRYL